MRTRSSVSIRRATSASDSHPSFDRRKKLIKHSDTFDFFRKKCCFPLLLEKFDQESTCNIHTWKSIQRINQDTEDDEVVQWILNNLRFLLSFLSTTTTTAWFNVLDSVRVFFVKTSFFHLDEFAWFWLVVSAIGKIDDTETNFRDLLSKNGSRLKVAASHKFEIETT